MGTQGGPHGRVVSPSMYDSDLRGRYGYAQPTRTHPSSTFDQSCDQLFPERASRLVSSPAPLPRTRAVPTQISTTKPAKYSYTHSSHSPELNGLEGLDISEFGLAQTVLGS